MKVPHLSWPGSVRLAPAWHQDNHILPTQAYILLSIS